MQGSAGPLAWGFGSARKSSCSFINDNRIWLAGKSPRILISMYLASRAIAIRDLVPTPCFRHGYLLSSSLHAASARTAERALSADGHCWYSCGGQSGCHQWKAATVVSSWSSGSAVGVTSRSSCGRGGSCSEFDDYLWQQRFQVQCIHPFDLGANSHHGQHCASSWCLRKMARGLKEGGKVSRRSAPWQWGRNSEHLFTRDNFVRQWVCWTDPCAR